MKLQSMTDFVLNESKTKSKEIAIINIYNYALFLKQTLKLEMFVPCDDNGNVLKDPGLIPSYELEQYRKAKEKVLFEGFTVLSYEDGIIELECEDIFINYNKEEDLFFLDSWNGDALIMNIECLVNLINHTASNITLTQTQLNNSYNVHNNI